EDDGSYKTDFVQGNFIGTDPSGRSALGNGAFGVEIDNVSYVYIGSDQANGRNVISGNAAGGIFIHGSNAGYDYLNDNLIGTQADGVSPLGNGGPGILLDGDTNNNHIGSGSPDQANTIAFNAGPGVEILQAQGNFIRANSIFANGGLGIDLAGAAANNLQTSPVLTQMASYGGLTFLTG